MHTEFVSVSMTRAEAIELYVALIQRAMLEDRVRQEKGLEPVARREWLERLAMLVRFNVREQEVLEQTLDEDLWEHAWYVFTDEWAWHRARQEVERERQKLPQKIEDEKFQRLVERRYQRDFEKYVNELEMRGEAEKKIEVKKQRS